MGKIVVAVFSASPRGIPEENDNIEKRASYVVHWPEDWIKNDWFLKIKNLIILCFLITFNINIVKIRIIEFSCFPFITIFPREAYF